jgi:hypothetical protein
MIEKFQLKADLQPLPAGYPISAKIVADSISEVGIRLTTLELVFPRYILAELNTHRATSKNSSSSRAIPTKKQIQAILDNPVFPVRWGKNQAGMQAAKENLTGEDLAKAKLIWLDMVHYVGEKCQELTDLGLHKQWASRPLEAFTTMKVVLSATEFNNLFLLRDHNDAQDEIAHLAQAMKIAMNGSEPKLIKVGEWHLPYISDEDKSNLSLSKQLKVSASRCARTSYKTQHGVTSTLDEDTKMFDRLTYGMKFGEENPFHASPTEHQATPWIHSPEKFRLNLFSNFNGWTQFRKIIENGSFNSES